jgi:hypothetical protein
MADENPGGLWSKLAILSGFLTAVAALVAALHVWYPASPTTTPLPPAQPTAVPVPAAVPAPQPSPAPLPAAVPQPAPALPNGTYSAERGYDGDKSETEPLICPSEETFRVTVQNEVVSFVTSEWDSKGPLRRQWTGRIDQKTGSIAIDGSVAVPQTNLPLKITGPFAGATMESDYCGRGYFRIQR